MVLYYFVFPFREETEENNEMSGLFVKGSKSVRSKVVSIEVRFDRNL